MKRTAPGRPAIDDDDPSVGVHVSLPSRTYDDVYRRARLEGVSPPEIIRRDMRIARDIDGNKKT